MMAEQQEVFDNFENGPGVFDGFDFGCELDEKLSQIPYIEDNDLSFSDLAEKISLEEEINAIIYGRDEPCTQDSSLGQFNEPAQIEQVEQDKLKHQESSSKRDFSEMKSSEGGTIEVIFKAKRGFGDIGQPSVFTSLARLLGFFGSNIRNHSHSFFDKRWYNFSEKEWSKYVSNCNHDCTIKRRMWVDNIKSLLLHLHIRSGKPNLEFLDLIAPVETDRFFSYFRGFNPFWCLKNSFRIRRSKFKNDCPLLTEEAKRDVGQITEEDVIAAVKTVYREDLNDFLISAGYNIKHNTLIREGEEYKTLGIKTQAKTYEHRASLLKKYYSSERFSSLNPINRPEILDEFLESFCRDRFGLILHKPFTTHMNDDFKPKERKIQSKRTVNNYMVNASYLRRAGNILANKLEVSQLDSHKHEGIDSKGEEYKKIMHHCKYNYMLNTKTFFKDLRLYVIYLSFVECSICVDHELLQSIALKEMTTIYSYLETGCSIKDAAIATIQNERFELERRDTCRFLPDSLKEYKGRLTDKQKDQIKEKMKNPEFIKDVLQTMKIHNAGHKPSNAICERFNTRCLGGEYLPVKKQKVEMPKEVSGMINMINILSKSNPLSSIDPI